MNFNEQLRNKVTIQAYIDTIDNQGDKTVLTLPVKTFLGVETIIATCKTEHLKRINARKGMFVQLDGKMIGEQEIEVHDLLWLH